MSLSGYKEKRIGMVCRLTAGKHVLESIKAMDLIHKKYPDWKFEIIGSGVLQNECETLIGNLNAKDYIDLHGWVEHSGLHYVTRKWRYLLFPTDTEGMPNALLELMGWGIPGIASSVGGIIDIIQDGSNGLIITDCSINEIYNGLYRAILIPENQYADMAQNAYETIADKFSLEAAKKDEIETLSVRKDQKV